MKKFLRGKRKMMMKENEVRRAEKWAEGLGRTKSQKGKKFFALFFEGREPAMEVLGIENEFMVNEINKSER
jgi:hypothetical protein